MILLTLPVALWALRIKTPAALGLCRDGAKPGADADQPSALPDADAGAVAREFTLAEAASTSGFWLLMGGTLLFYFSYSSVLAHAAAFFGEAGLSAQEAARTVGLTAGAAVVGVLLSGVLVRYYSTSRLLLAMFVTLFCALAMLLIISVRHTVSLRYPFVALFGLAIGAIDVVAISFLRETFGGRQYAHIFGAWYFASLAGLMLGPVISGAIYDGSGSYQIAFIAAVAAASLGGVLTLPLQKAGVARQVRKKAWVHPYRSYSILPAVPRS